MRSLSYQRTRSPKLQLIFSGLHGIVSQKVELFKITALRTLTPRICVKGRGARAGFYGPSLIHNRNWQFAEALTWWSTAECLSVRISRMAVYYQFKFILS
jgi:hypothetical protein